MCVSKPSTRNFQRLMLSCLRSESASCISVSTLSSEQLVYSGTLCRIVI